MFITSFPGQLLTSFGWGSFLIMSLIRPPPRAAELMQIQMFLLWTFQPSCWIMGLKFQRATASCNTVLHRMSWITRSCKTQFVSSCRAVFSCVMSCYMHSHWVTEAVATNSPKFSVLHSVLYQGPLPFPRPAHPFSTSLKTLPGSYQNIHVLVSPASSYLPFLLQGFLKSS